ncbi:MAG: hypothetical protein L3J91_04210, partial [Thermoplasmata archaeon]|nr:hypothetical protein [Thermoplasmata archaeon]
IKRGQVRFDPLADILADRDYDVTVISSSPLLEHDAMYMKLLYERALTRRWTKRHAPPPAVVAKPKAALASPARSAGKLAARPHQGKPHPPARPVPTGGKSHADRRSR